MRCKVPRTIKKLVATNPEKFQLQAIYNSQSNGAKMNINSKSNNGNRKIFAKFILVKNNQQKTIHLEGQNAKTLIALKQAKSKGITTFQANELKLLRLSSYIHILRHQHNINIITIREGKSRTARYVLIDLVELLQSPASIVGGIND